jgi:hypothetical protein
MQMPLYKRKYLESVRYSVGIVRREMCNEQDGRDQGQSTLDDKYWRKLQVPLCFEYFLCPSGHPISPSTARQSKTIGVAVRLVTIK